MDLFELKPIAIAVIHLPNLRRVAAEKRVEEVVEFVEREARVLEEAGFDAVIVENFNDRPYTKVVREPEILGLMSIALYTAKKSFSGFVGLNILRCSAIEAYRIAYSLGAHFIRVNTVAETIATDSGLIEPVSPSLAELRLFMPGVKVLSDVLCKHSGSLDLALRFITKLAASVGEAIWHEVLRDSVKEIVLDATERGCADAVIVTGGRTGQPPSLSLVKLVREVSRVPVIIGSGMTPENVGKYLEYSDGVIVGSYIKVDGRAGNPTDPERAKRMALAIKERRT